MDGPKRCTLHNGGELVHHCTDSGFTIQILLQFHRDCCFDMQLQTSLCAYCNVLHIRCYSVAAVKPGVSPAAVNGLDAPQYDAVMSTCFRMRCRVEPLDESFARLSARDRKPIIQIRTSSLGLKDVQATESDFHDTHHMSAVCT